MDKFLRGALRGARGYFDARAEAEKALAEILKEEREHERALQLRRQPPGLHPLQKELLGLELEKARRPVQAGLEGVSLKELFGLHSAAQEMDWWRAPDKAAVVGGPESRAIEEEISRRLGVEGVGLGVGLGVGVEPERPGFLRRMLERITPWAIEGEEGVGIFGPALPHRERKFVPEPLPKAMRRIRVRERATGRTGTIEIKLFDPKLYERL